MAQKADIDTHADVRRVPGMSENVHDFADPVWMRVGQMEGSAVEALDMRDMIDGSGDKVDRNQVYSSSFDANHGHPLRKKLSNPLDNAEEIIGTVDLIHFAGLGVADDDARPVHAPGHGTLAPDDLLRLVLAFEVGMIELARFVEHVLPKRALIEPGSCNGAHMMKAPRADVLRKIGDVSRARDIGFHLDQSVCGEIVDRGEVEDVIDVALQRLLVFV